MVFILERRDKLFISPLPYPDKFHSSSCTRCKSQYPNEQKIENKNVGKVL